LTSIALIIFGILLQILEIVRIYLGLYNYGLKNLDLSDNNQFGIWTVRNSFYLFAEPWHIWPWTYAGKFLAGLKFKIKIYKKLLFKLRKLNWSFGIDYRFNWIPFLHS
jgi:hypothetical protein